MERILVGMDIRHGAWEALSRAISLAKRIDARTYVLLVLPPAAHPMGASTRKRLELLIELAKSEGIRIDYFITQGDYEEEVIRFVNHNRITLLVAECTDGDGHHLDRDLASIRKIRHRITCRMELVSPRKTQQFMEREDEGHGHSTTPVSTNRRK